MILYCTLKEYLSNLQASEEKKPLIDRKIVPNLSNINKTAEISYSTISRIANNKTSQLSYETGAKIIEAVRKYGFDMQVHDFISVREA